MKFNPYKILNVLKCTNSSEVIIEYRKKALLLHPDRGGSPKEFQLLELAKHVLTSPKLKHEFDNGLADNRSIWAWVQRESETSFPNLFRDKGQQSKKRKEEKIAKEARMVKKRKLVEHFKQIEDALKKKYKTDLQNIRALKKARISKLK